MTLDVHGSGTGATRYETAILQVNGPTPEGRPVGLGLLVTLRQVVTCAHVVNTALGRRQHDRRPPGEQVRVHVSFPCLPGFTGVRSARVAKWVPLAEDGGGDVAGLELDEAAPSGAEPAWFETTTPRPGTIGRVFGYPGDPSRERGAFVDVEVKGEVPGPLIQVESCGHQTVKPQRGYSGSPVWNDRTGRALGLLQFVPLDAGPEERDAYLLPPQAIAGAWDEPFDYLLVQPNPYRGLDPFTDADEEVFFGRAGDIGDLIAKVNAQPVVVVVGPSGVGKSSLVRAGVIPRLRREQQKLVVPIRPGLDPWLRLAVRLLEAQKQEVTQDRTERLIAELRQKGLGDLARFLRSQDRGLLLVVDQFEELLATGAEPDRSLIELLLPPPQAAPDAARVVLTLRNDFLPALQAIPGVQLNDRTYFVSPLTPDQMRAAIEQPAKARGVSFEPGLAEEIVREVGDGAALPLLEYALEQLWGTQRGKRLTFEAYHRMGGIAGVLDQAADEQIAGLEDAADRLNHALIRLVHVAADDPGRATRRRVRERDVTGEEWQVLQHLASARITSIDSDRVGDQYAELTHESLIRVWPRLRDLVTENRDFLGWLDRMEQHVAEADLLSEALIPEARRWLDARSGDIPESVKGFIETSETELETRVRELREARDRAEALRLAAHAELAIRTARPATVALALGVESMLTEPTVQSDSVLRCALRLHPRTLSRFDHDRRVTSVAFSPDGTQVATGSTDGSARVFDVGSRAELVRLPHDGHGVYAVAFSPDGTQIATGSEDGHVRVFDAATGEELIQLRHAGPVHAVAFSPDGTQIATGSEDGHVRVFDAATGAEKTRRLARLYHNGPVYAVAFSPDGTRLVTGSSAHSARVLDAVTRARLVRLYHDGPVYAVAFSADGTRIATGSEDGHVRVFDAATGAEKTRLDHGHGVYAVAFSPDGTRIATGSTDGSARVFDASTGTELARLEHDGPVQAVAFSPDGTRVATGSDDGTARVFAPVAGAERTRLGHGGEVTAVAFSPDGIRVITGSTDRFARVFDPGTGEEKTRLGHGHGVYAVAFSPDGTQVITGSWDRSARVFDSATWAEKARLLHDGPVHAVTFSPDGTWMGMGSEDNFVRVFAATDGAERARLLHGGPVRAVAFSPDSTMLATGSEDGTARVFDVATGTEEARFSHGREVSSVAFSPDGARVGTGSDDGSARIFDVATGAERARLDHGGEVTAVAFSPDGNWLVTGSGDNLARVFDAATWAEKAQLEHDDPVRAVAFSPDGARVGTGSDDGSARIFVAATGAERARLDHGGEVTAVAFSPDGNWLVTGSTDKTARIFEAAPGPLVRRALRAMDRPLNSAELRRYSLPPDCLHIQQWDRREREPVSRHPSRNPAGD